MLKKTRLSSRAPAKNLVDQRVRFFAGARDDTSSLKTTLRDLSDRDSPLVFVTVASIASIVSVASLVTDILHVSRKY